MTLTTPASDDAPGEGMARLTASPSVRLGLPMGQELVFGLPKEPFLGLGVLEILLAPGSRPLGILYAWVGFESL